MNNLRNVDLNLLVVLDALLAERHVTRAALRLNMSQPAVSHALGRLRILLDDPLFLRQGGALEPTIRALELHAPLAEALGRIRAVLTPEGFDPTRTAHRFRLAMSDYGASLILPKLTRHLRQIAPRIDLVITQHSREGMIAAVLDDEVDLGFGVFPALPDRVLGEVLYLDDYACLLDQSRIGGGAGLDLTTYLAAPHALVAVHGQASTEVDQALRTLGLARHVALILPHCMLAPRLIAGTDLILTVARSSLSEVATDPALAILPPPFPLPRISFRQISQLRRRTDPALRWLRAEIAACLAG